MLLRRLRENWALALGEVALIFVGVLLAIGADRWQQHRADLVLEEQYLHGILDDLETEIGTLSSAIQRSEDGITKPLQTAALELVNDELIDGDTVAFINRLGMVAYLNIMRWQNGTYLDLVNSGHSALIRDFALRQAIFRYYSSPQYYSQYFEAFLDTKTSATLSNIPWRLFEYETSFLDRLPADSRTVDLASIMADPEVENAVFVSLTVQQWMKDAYEGHRSRAEDLAAQIRAVIED